MSKKKTIEETFKKVTQREHVLSRPDTYIGDTKKHLEEMYVYESNLIVKKMIEYSPGFLKIFDEILTNALDHSARDPTLKSIKVDFDKELNQITVWNDGMGIPVVEHKEHKIYVPELIFGHLLTGSNYDDTEQRTGAGRNGFGSKLTNIYSKKFVVETIDSKEGLKFVQEHSDNMTIKTKAKITKNAGKSYTKISYIADFARFGMIGLEKDTLLLLTKRVFDCIATTNQNVSIYLNGEKLKGKGLVDYTKYYFEESKVISESNSQQINKTDFFWEYCIIPHSNFEQVSFVNGNATFQGGKHVDYIMNQIVNKLKTMLETKKKLKELKPAFIKDRMFLFLRATVVNPEFNGQTKEQLRTPSKDFGCKIEVSDKFIEKIYKSSITDEIVEFCKYKESSSLAKHSVSGDTPLLLKDENNKIIIKTIDKITETFTESKNNNDYGKSDYKVWTEEGWTDIIHIMRHKSSKQMYRILTHTGFVDVTEDHSLLTDKIKEISPKDCKVGDYLLHSFPEFVDNSFELKLNYKEMKSVEMRNYAKYLKIPYYKISKDKLIELIKNKHNEYNKLLKINIDYDNTINYDEAWVMGLFWSDGSAAIYTNNYNFSITNVNKEFLIKAQKILEKEYNEKTSIYKCERDNTRQTIYRLQLNGSLKIKYIVEKYINLFYYGKNHKTKNGYKYVPLEILNASKKIREQFLNGVYCGDGRSHNINTKGIKEISIDSKISSQGIYYLAKSLGYFVSIQCREDKPNIFNLILGKYYYNMNPNIIKKIIKLGYTDNYVYDLETKNHHFQAGVGQMIVHNTDGKKVNKIWGIPKLEDANWAGTNKSKECTLILTEGLSAMKFALDGRAVVGPEKFGVFPLRGKLLNIRAATISQLISNEEINHIKQIVGLKQEKVYKNADDLRYGKIMILTDADVDGSHIKSLFINFIHAYWPSLIKLNFIQTLKTPIVKVTKGKKLLEFYTEQDYHKWEETIGNTNGYQIKYFKGLGTSTKEDAKNNFERFQELKVDYYYKDIKCDESILLAFDKDKNVKSKKKVDENVDDEDIDENLDENDNSTTTGTNIKCTDKRKVWLGNYDKSSYIDVKENRVSYQDQINKELIHFSIYDNTRSIPNLCDGLKPSQRKILYYMLKKNITKDIKVAQLSGYISAEMAYHHGETSLQGAIINMAQNYVGSNNINLLFPNGNFGSRWLCGADAASPRYIYTRLENHTTQIYNVNDLPLLNQQTDDGQDIEPEFLLPILPMILVNGCSGIGTGYSTNIPPYNPKDIISNLKRIMANKEPLKMTPWFKNFNGTVVPLEKEGSFETRGKWNKLSDTQIKITELPIGMGVTTYKEFLENLIESNTSKKDPKKKNKIILKDIQSKTTDENTDICFIIEFKNTKDLATLIKNNTLEKELKLTKTFSTTNMYLFDEDTKLLKYNDPNDILSDWSDIRLEYYQKRKDYITDKLQKESIILNSKARFIRKYIDGELDINKKSKDVVINLLEKNKFPLIEDSYNYLLSLPMSSLTLERIKSLEKECESKQKELTFIKSKTKQQLWEIDLNELEFVN